MHLSKRGPSVTARHLTTQGRSPLFAQHSTDADIATASTAQDISGARVEEVLRNVPSHGWTAGWIGRRDRALLVLSQMAGLSYETIAELTVADVTVRDGMAIIRTTGGTTTLRKNEDDLICAPCALARWLHALDMTVVYSSCRVSTAVIARAAPLTSQSPHLCQGNVSVTESTRRMTLLPSIDQYGPRADSPLPAPRPVRSPSGRIPAQRVDSTQAGSLPVPQARRYGVAGAEPARSYSADAPARGLEGRARYLLEHRSDVSEIQ